MKKHKLEYTKKLRRNQKLFKEAFPGKGENYFKIP